MMLELALFARGRVSSPMLYVTGRFASTCATQPFRKGCLCPGLLQWPAAQRARSGADGDANPSPSPAPELQPFRAPAQVARLCVPASGPRGFRLGRGSSAVVRAEPEGPSMGESSGRVDWDQAWQRYGLGFYMSGRKARRRWHEVWEIDV